MNQTFQSIRVGIFFVLGVILIYAVYTVIGTRQFASETGYSVIAEFDDVRTITTGSDVRMAGVRVGEVSGASLSKGRGQVTLRIDETVEIPVDSVAQIAMSSLLGQHYIAIDYGNETEVLTDGAEIMADAGPDFNEILEEVQQLGEKLNKMADGFSGLDGSGMGELFSNLNGLVTDNRSRFDNVMDNLESITTKLDGSKGTLGKLINDEEMYNELMGVVTELKSASGDMQDALGGAREIIAQVQAGEGTLGKLLVDDSIALELEATMANMREFSDKLNSGEGTLGKLVTDDSLYYELQSMLNKADQALDSMGDSGPITAVGAVSGALF
jgi:phospholipid/cholesterol/gamma-HCH transport system substrate-binding protein